MKLKNMVLESKKSINLTVAILFRPKLWRSFLVRSHLTYQERIKLYQLASQACTIVEIGSYLGASSCCFGAAAKQCKTSKVRVICVDTWNNDAMTEGGRDTWAVFQKNTRHIAEVILPVRGFSTDVINHVKEIATTTDLLFIDGDHSYEGVKSDWEAYQTLTKSGTVVVFHDSGWAKGVQRVIVEDVMKCVSSHGSLPNLWWGKIA